MTVPVRLVLMPFGSVTTPSLAFGTFKAALAEAGVEATVEHLNLHFARAIGFAAYETIARFKGVETQVSEWLFSREAWGREPGPSEERFLDLCGEELGTIPHVVDQRQWLKKVRNELVGTWLDGCVDHLCRQGVPRVVAFSCTFFQTIPSLALGRRLAARHPEIKLVYGGACFHGEMGEELMRVVPWIDAVATGEADTLVVPLFTALLAGEAPPLRPGLLVRPSRGGQVLGDPTAAPVEAVDLDAQPAPDYSDLFRHADAVGLSRSESWWERLQLPFETSRGCWWGAKHHCTFCGLNGQTMAFRARSAASSRRVVEALGRQHPRVRHLLAVDNILERSFFTSLLPSFADDPPAPGVQYFWEVKANLTREELQILRRAGVRWIQPGIESLSDHLLRLMNKGVRALQNVWLLRACQEEGLIVQWNNLIRIPGETADDYAQQARWMRALVHLRPAYGGSPRVEIHRFSPYFTQRDRWIHNLRPAAWYCALYPADTVALEKVAYYFDGDWRDVLDESAYDELLRASSAWTAAWRDAAEVPVCRLVHRHEAGAEIEDTRPGRPGRWALGRVEAEVLDLLERPASRERLLRESEHPSAEVLLAVETLLERELVLETGGQLLSVVVLHEAPAVDRERRRRSLRQITNQAPVCLG
jgi:ribosomal peptide maturation radical SAM protein 1